MTEPTPESTGTGQERRRRAYSARNRALDVHLNLNVRGRLPSATVAINERSDELRRQGRTICKLGLGQSPFPVPQSVVRSLQENAFQKDYLPVKGLPALREAIAEYHRRKEDVPATAADVLVGPGSKELMFLIQLVYYGDLVIPTPTWVSYAPQAGIIGRQVQWIQTRSVDRWQLMPDQLQALCDMDPGRPRIVILNYPNNPTGGTYKLEELKGLARVARENKVVLLSDEIYSDLHYKGQHVSISRFYPEGTIISSGLSKWCGAGGWRIGHFVFPTGMRWLLDAMAAVASETYTATSAPIQHAAVRAFQGGPDIERYLKHSRRVLSTLARWIVNHLTNAGIRVEPPRGAFYLFLDFENFRNELAARNILTSAVLCDHLLEEAGVAILPGSAFGRPESELTARMAFVDFDGAKALEAIEPISSDAKLNGTFVRSIAPQMSAAIDRIVEWTAAARNTRATDA